MADAQTQTRSPAPSRDATWFRQHVLTRFFASMWWLVMTAFTACIIVSWASLIIGVAFDSDWTGLTGAVLAAVVFIPIAREWPNASRMGRMLRHGT